MIGFIKAPKRALTKVRLKKVSLILGKKFVDLGAEG